MWGLGGVIVVALIWETVTLVGLVDPFFSSSPSLVLAALLSGVAAGTFTEDVASTLVSFGLGFGIAVVVGVPLGLLSGRFRSLDLFLDTPIWFSYNAPAMAFYPLLIIWLGFGRPTVVALAALLAFYPIYANSLAGVRYVDAVLIKAGRSFGADGLRLFTAVVLPASVPLLVAGFRQGVGRALLGTIVAELFASNIGLGARMHRAGQLLQTTEYFTALVITIGLGVLSTELVSWWERRVSSWRL